MSAEQTPDIERVLAEHRLSNVVCTCMAWSASWGDDRPAIEAGHRAHVAQALAPVLAAAVREAKARAWGEGRAIERFHAAQIRNYLSPLGISSGPPVDPPNPYRADRVAEPQHEAATSGKGAACKYVLHGPGDSCDCKQRLAAVVKHTRTPTPHGPDYCAECSEAISEWVQWPCEGAGDE